MKAGWETKKLGDVCQIIGGGTPSKANDEFYNGKILWATVRDMKFDMLSETEHRITEKAIKSSATNIIPKGNVVIATRVGLGKVCLLENDTAINQDLRGVVPKYKGKLSEKYLFFWFKSIAHLIEQAGTGATVHGVKLPFVKSLEIPVPPLPEQRRIVAILDEAFAGIAAAKENAEQNLKNAKEVFESHLEQAVYQENENWRKTTVGSEVDLISGFPFKSYGYTDSEESVKLLRGDNIVQGKIRWDDVKKWPKNDIISYNSYLLCSGDVVLAMDRPWVNAGLKRAQISSNDLPCLLVQRTARLRGKKIDNRFLFYLISSNAFIQHIVGVQTGIGVPHISGKQIKDFEFFIPPMTEQKNITQQLDSLSAETSRLESLYQQKLSNLEELKKSLLQQAFSGAL